MAESSQYVHCPLCGMEFQPVDTVCAHGCPLGKNCNNVRCPNCNYEFPAAPQSFAWLRKIFRYNSRPKLPDDVETMALDRLRSGERGEVLNLSRMGSSRQNTLTVFGLTPGVEITLLQRSPSYVIRVGETELGLDREIARQIFVKRL
jgi:Fe2+ transport system protein FeoA